MDFCLFSSSYFTFGFHGFSLKKLKIIQYDFWTGVRNNKDKRVFICYTIAKKVIRKQIHCNLIDSKSTWWLGGWVGMSGNGGWQNKTWTLYKPCDLKPSHTCTQTPNRVWEKRFPLHSFHSKWKTTHLNRNDEKINQICGFPIEHSWVATKWSITPPSYMYQK